MSKNIKYLGTVLSSLSGNPHVEGPITAAQKAFYSLQGGGLMFNSVHPETAINIYRTAVKSVLMSGCSAIQLSKDLLCKLDSTQGKLIKVILGISYSSHTTPILEAIGVSSVSTSVATNSMGDCCALAYIVTQLPHNSISIYLITSD